MKQTRPPHLGFVLILIYTCVSMYLLIRYTNLKGAIGFIAVVGCAALLLWLTYPLLLWLGLLEDVPDE